MKPLHNKFSASTLPEVLVMMILAGILLLTISEGISLLKTFSARLASAIGKETEYYNHYYTLGEWTARPGRKKSLRKQGEDLSAELEYRLKALGNLLEPLLILFVGMVVAVILIAMYLPMFALGGIMG